MCDARDLAADRTVEHVVEYGFLNGRHVHADTGDICFIASWFAHGDGAAGRVAGLVAGRQRVAPGDVAAAAIVVHRHGLGHRNERAAAGVRGEVDEVHAELVVDQPGDGLLRPRDHRLRDDDGVRTDGLDRVGVERLCHAYAHHRTLHHEFLARGETPAEREHHDAGEADANDEHPGLSAAENP